MPTTAEPRKLLCQYQLPYSGVEPPATYMVDGKQCVVTPAAGGRNPKAGAEGTYITFALP